jgi:hypothetical protein
MRALERHGLASFEPDTGKGRKGYKVSVKFSWDDLLNTVVDPKNAEPRLRALVAELREEVE